jgi:hypothetical protein
MRIFLVVTISVAFLLGGCAKRIHPITQEQADNNVDSDDIPPGPGLISGEDGVFKWEY